MRPTTATAAFAVVLCIAVGAGFTDALSDLRKCADQQCSSEYHVRSIFKK
jgi:hypothetical protein